MEIGVTRTRLNVALYVHCFLAPQHHNLIQNVRQLSSVRTACSEDLLLCSNSGYSFIAAVADPNRV